MAESVAAAGMRDGRARPPERLIGRGRARAGWPLRYQGRRFARDTGSVGPQRSQMSAAGCGLLTEQITFKLRYVGVFNTTRHVGADRF